MRIYLSSSVSLSLFLYELYATPLGNTRGRLATTTRTLQQRKHKQHWTLNTQHEHEHKFEYEHKGNGNSQRQNIKIYSWIEFVFVADIL